MNIHEHQAKEILKDYGAPVSKGVVIYSISELKNKAKRAERVIIASDLDREGEAIGYHICKCLGLDIDTTPRIVFTEITCLPCNNKYRNQKIYLL